MLLQRFHQAPTKVTVIRMENGHHSFDDLLDLVARIPDEEIENAIALVRRYRAGLRPEPRPSSYLLSRVDQLSEQEHIWLEAVLCVRVQQSGSERAWRKFAHNAYRELV